MPRVVGNTKINKTWFLPLWVVETKVQGTSHNALGWAPQRRKEASGVCSAWGSSRRCHRNHWETRWPVSSRNKWIVNYENREKGTYQYRLKNTWWLMERKQRKYRSYWDDLSLFLNIPIQQNFLRWRKCFVCIVATSHTHSYYTPKIWSVQMVDLTFT